MVSVPNVSVIAHHLSKQIVHCILLYSKNTLCALAHSKYYTFSTGVCELKDTLNLFTPKGDDRDRDSVQQERSLRYLVFLNSRSSQSLSIGGLALG